MTCPSCILVSMVNGRRLRLNYALTLTSYTDLAFYISPVSIRWQSQRDVLSLEVIRFLFTQQLLLAKLIILRRSSARWVYSKRGESCAN